MGKRNVSPTEVCETQNKCKHFILPMNYICICSVKRITFSFDDWPPTETVPPLVPSTLVKIWSVGEVDFTCVRLRRGSQRSYHLTFGTVCRKRVPLVGLWCSTQSKLTDGSKVLLYPLFSRSDSKVDPPLQIKKYYIWTRVGELKVDNHITTELVIDFRFVHKKTIIRMSI